MKKEKISKDEIDNLRIIKNDNTSFWFHTSLELG